MHKNKGDRLLPCALLLPAGVLMAALVFYPAAVTFTYSLKEMKPKMEFPGRKWFKNVLLISMVLPVFATIIPLFRVFIEHDLLDSQFWLSLVYVSSFLPMST